MTMDSGPFFNVGRMDPRKLFCSFSANWNMNVFFFFPLNVENLIDDHADIEDNKIYIYYMYIVSFN